MTNDAWGVMSILYRWIDSELQKERKKKLLELGAKIAEDKLTADERGLFEALHGSFGSSRRKGRRKPSPESRHNPV